MNQNMIPKETRNHAMGDMIDGFRRRLEAFVFQCIGDFFLRSFLWVRDDGVCQHCKVPIVDVKDLTSWQIHHIDYHHVCQGTFKQIAKFAFVPDCETCHKLTPQYFESCIKRLALVHTGCNGQLNAHTGIQPGERLRRRDKSEALQKLNPRGLPGR